MMKMRNLLHRSGLGLLLVFTLILAACQPATTQPPISVPTVAPGSTPGVSGPTVQVDDQMSDGKTVVIREVISQGPAWIAIHRQNSDGSVGDAIGHAAIHDGINRNVVVTLDQSQVTAVMYAMLHNDAGTVGVYEFPGPDEPVFVNGVMLVPPFKWSLGTASVMTPAVEIANQDVKSGVVTVSKVVSDGPGWIVIQAKNPDGSPGKVIGYAPVHDGENQNVSVTIDPTGVADSLIAVLYIDAGDVGTFEGSGPDIPVTVGDQTIASTFATSATAMAMANPTVAATPVVVASTPQGSTDNSMPGMAVSTPGGPDQSMLVVKDQPIISNTVMISDVVSAGPGWVVVYSDENYQPGVVVGYTAVNSGESKGVMVQIDPTKVTPTLFAQLQVDLGQVGTFEFPGPDLPVMIGVKMVQGAFNVLSSAQAPGTTPAPTGQLVKVSDQEIRGNTVRVDEVDSKGPGWIGVHIQQPDGTLGPPIGDAHVEDGVTKDLIVNIKGDLATKVMYAMLHYDKGTVGSWEFPGPDAPVDGDMNIVMPSFNVTAGLSTDNTELKVGQSNGLNILVDGQGYTLYTSLMDAPGKTNCDAICHQKWIPVIVHAKLLADTGVLPNKLGLITLPDGTRQVTYSGYPLYYYYADTQPGDTLGQGMDGVWFTNQP